MKNGVYLWPSELPINIRTAIAKTPLDWYSMSFKQWIDRISKAGLMTREIKTEIAAWMLSGNNEG